MISERSHGEGSLPGGSDTSVGFEGQVREEEKNNVMYCIL